MDNTYKILVLNHEFPPVGGGASPVAFQLCRQLVQLGHDVDVVTMHYRDLPAFERLDGVNVYRTPALRKRPDICLAHELATYLPGAIVKTLRLARLRRYDIIHCHFLVPAGPLAWLVSKLTGIPFLITCHGSDVPGYNPDRFKAIHKAIMPAWHFLVHRTVMMTTPSDALKSLIERNCSRANVRTVPNGIHTDFFRPSVKRNSILLCSRILPRKGFQYVIEAVHDLHLDWRLDVLGDGPYLNQLKSVSQGSKTPIEFHGWIDRHDERFRQLYEQAAIFILPSSSESFGMVIAEAMAAGSAVIASDIAAHREVLGDAGLYVQPAGVEQIRNCLLKLTGDEALRSQLQQRVRIRVCEQFDWSVVTGRYVDCYRDVIEGRT